MNHSPASIIQVRYVVFVEDADGIFGNPVVPVPLGMINCHGQKTAVRTYYIKVSSSSSITVSII